eukprot:Hpha_TRINITY_DN18796_c0_g1::TRINITY_DN18796_c0_g1_i1::g.47540::m.47540
MPLGTGCGSDGGRRRMWWMAAVVTVGILVLLRPQRGGERPDRQVWPHVEAVEGTEVLSEAPSGTLKGAVFFAHGCGHAARDWWLPGPSCKHCLGLPEEVRLRRLALRRGLLVIVVSSLETCWQLSDPPSEEGDVKAVLRALALVRTRHHAESLPLYAVGASSGGAFVQVLPHHTKVDGLVAQIMVPVGQLLTAPHYPPICFLHMPRDEGTNDAIHDWASTKKGSTRYAEIMVQPRPITPAFLGRSVRLGVEGGRMVAGALRSKGFLDESGLLRRDPRRSEWRAALEGKDTVELLRQSADELVPDESPISELLNLAYAQHEIVSDGFGTILDWLEAGGQGRVPTSVRDLE